MARSDEERAHQISLALRDQLFPPEIAARLFVTHTRPEVLLGLVQPLHTGRLTSGVGYSSRGGKLNTQGLLFLNHCSWAHCLAEAARLLQIPTDGLLNPEELDVLHGNRSPHGIVIPEVSV